MKVMAKRQKEHPAKRAVGIVTDVAGKAVEHSPEAVGVAGGSVAFGMGGAAAGAAGGFLLGGPPGAAIGFVLGITGGTLGGGAAGFKFARWIKRSAR